MPDNKQTKRVTRSDQDTIDEAGQVLDGTSKKGRLASMLPFLGPAFIASVAYVDPGNFATNIAGGSPVWLHPAVGDCRQQPDGHADPVAVGQAGHRHRQEPGRAVPRAFPRRW